MKSFLKIILISAFLVATFWAYQKYNEFYIPNVPESLENEYLKIPTGSSFEEVVHLLKSQNLISDTASFIRAAEWMAYKQPSMRPGRFKIKEGWSNLELVRHLRNGEQATVRVVLNNKRLLEDVAGEVGKIIEADSTDLINLFYDDKYLEEIGYTKETLMSLFIPNTYDFFWTTNANKFMEKMIKEHDKFWQKESRAEKAKTKNLSKSEIYTLASIIQKETNQNQEKPRMAGVYLNRIETGIPLQADPTCVFARRDFDTRRVTDYHTKFDSPYNTYMYAGLPPGPIAMASISSLDAILNAEDHDYIFFCAKGDGTGFHNFAKTLRGHNQNAATYKRNLKRRGRR